VRGAYVGKLAAVYAYTGRTSAAQRLFDEAFAIDRAVGERRFEGIHLTDYAYLLKTTGRPAEAEHALRDAIGILNEVMDAHAGRVARGLLAELVAEMRPGDPEIAALLANASDQE
jgi:tetratricopeptide (TPR) repeat protein